MQIHLSASYIKVLILRDVLAQQTWCAVRFISLVCVFASLRFESSKENR